jgi:hypothetical protein
MAHGAQRPVDSLANILHSLANLLQPIPCCHLLQQVNLQAQGSTAAL